MKIVPSNLSKLYHIIKSIKYLPTFLLFSILLIGILTSCSGIDVSNTDLSMNTSQNSEYMLDGNIGSINHFSEGKAYVSFDKSFTKYDVDKPGGVFVDKAGKILFTLNDNQLPFTPFQNGVCIICNRPEGTDNTDFVPDTIIDSQNNIIASPGENGYTAFCDSTDGSFYNQNTALVEGWILAYSKSEDYLGTKIKIGVLDTKGEWIIPLNENNPISEYIEKNGDSELEYSYLGDGVVSFASYDYGYNFWNIKDNYWFTTDLIKLERFVIGNYVPENIHFENGITVFGTSSGKVFRMTNRGETNEIEFDFDPGLFVKPQMYSSGMFFYKDSYYNAYGQKIIDLSKYELSSDGPGPFVDDRALIVIKNTSGKQYFTLIDKTGEFLFEPIEMNGNDDTIDYTNQILIYNENTATSSVYHAYDKNGRKLFELEIPETSSFSVYRSSLGSFYEDLACFFASSLNPECYYIDKSGQRVLF